MTVKAAIPIISIICFRHLIEGLRLDEANLQFQSWIALDLDSYIPVWPRNETKDDKLNK